MLNIVYEMIPTQPRVLACSLKDCLKQPEMCDNIIGMMSALQLGESLGLPYRFQYQEMKTYYNGYLPHTNIVIDNKVISPGMVGDATEMCLALSEIGNNYNKEKAILSYTKWVNTKPFGLDKSASLKTLFFGVKDINDYNVRFASISNKDKETKQTNLSIARAAPLALIARFEDSMKACIEDCSITHPNKVNIDCNLVFVSVLRLLLRGKSKRFIRIYLQNTNTVSVNTSVGKLLIEEKLKRELHPHVKKAIKDALLLDDEIDFFSHSPKGTPRNEQPCLRNASMEMSWVCTTLFIALKSFLHFDTFEDAMEYVIYDQPKSDTAVNAAVTGALFGAHLGLKYLSTEDKTRANIPILSNYFRTTNRPYKMMITAN